MNSNAPANQNVYTNLDYLAVIYVTIQGTELRLVAELESSGFVVMRKPVPVGGAGDNPWARTPAAKAVPRNF
jgi:hypothetical protein